MSPLFDAALGKSESSTNSAKYVISTEKNQNDLFEKSHLEAAARSRFSHSSISGEAKAEGGRVKIQSNSRWWGRGDLDEVYNDGEAGDDNCGGDDTDDGESQGPVKLALVVMMVIIRMMRMVMIEVITQNKKKPGVLLPRSPPFGDRSTESGCRCRQQPEVFLLRSSYGRPAQSLKIFFRQMRQFARECFQANETKTET